MGTQYSVCSVCVLYDAVLHKGDPLGYFQHRSKTHIDTHERELFRVHHFDLSLISVHCETLSIFNVHCAKDNERECLQYV